MPVLRPDSKNPAVSGVTAIVVAILLVAAFLVYYFFVVEIPSATLKAQETNVAIFIFDKSENIDEKLNKVMMAEWKKIDNELHRGSTSGGWIIKVHTITPKVNDNDYFEFSTVGRMGAKMQNQKRVSSEDTWSKMTTKGSKYTNAEYLEMWKNAFNINEFKGEQAYASPLLATISNNTNYAEIKNPKNYNVANVRIYIFSDMLEESSSGISNFRTLNTAQRIEKLDQLVDAQQIQKPDLDAQRTTIRVVQFVRGLNSDYQNIKQFWEYYFSESRGGAPLANQFTWEIKLDMSGGVPSQGTVSQEPTNER